MTADTVVEMEELQGVLAAGREKGLVTAASLRSAIEEAELSSAQAHELFSYLEEHSIEVVEAEEASVELHVVGADAGEATGADAALPASEELDEEEREDEEAGDVRVRLRELKRAEADLSVDPSLDSLRLYLRSIGRVPLLNAAEEVSLAKRIERGDMSAKQHMVEANLRLDQKSVV